MSEVLNLIYRADGSVVNETGADPGIPRVTGYDRYWLAADLGQAHDFTAVTGIRDTQLPTVIDGRVKLGPRTRTVVFADKFRGVDYPAVVDYLSRLRNAPPFAGRAELAIDGSSLGRVVADLCFDQGLPVHPIQMVAGQGASKSGRYWNVGKTALVETAAVLFSSGDLTFAHDLPLRKEIEADLASFQTQTTAAGNQVISQSRNASGHGDLGISLIICAWASQHLSRNRIEVRKLHGYFG